MPWKKSAARASDRATDRPWYRCGSSTRTALLLVVCLVVVASVAGPAVASGTVSQPPSDSTLTASTTQPNPITVSSSPAAVGATITFSAADLGVESYRWEFGTGRYDSAPGRFTSAATGQEVRFGYAEPGTYTVRLTTVAADGTTANYTTSVTVTSTFAGVQQVEPGEQVNVDEPTDETTYGTVDVYGIDVDENESVGVGTYSGTGDESLLVYSPTGDLLASRSMGPTTEFSGVTAAETGTHYVVVQRDERVSTFYNLEFSPLFPPDGFEPNQEAATAERIGATTRLTGTITERDSEDWFVLEAGAGAINTTAELQRIAIGVERPNIGIEIYDASGTQIGELGSDVDVSGGAFNRTATTEVTADYTAEQRATVAGGTYYVRVTRVAGSVNLEGPTPYTVTVNATVPPVTDDDTLPTDPDGDGRYEDVNGDGVVNVVDVQALFDSLDDPTVQNNPAAFDFSGDGRVDVMDVQRLFAAGVEA
jgi:PKD repeat protein